MLELIEVFDLAVQAGIKSMKKVISTLSGAVLLLSCLITTQVQAGPIACSVSDAIAGGLIANACAGSDTHPGNPTDEANFINGLGGLFQNTFGYAAKTQNGAGGNEVGMTDWLLEDGAPVPAGYDFGFQLTAPAGLVGTNIDFVLAVKQGNNFIAYLFQNRTLNFNGGFNSENANSNPDFSHITGFKTTATSPCVPNGPTTCFPSVPEPGALTLLGIGLLGLGLSRRRWRLSAK